MRCLRIDENSPFRQLIGIGGVGTGIFFELEGDHTLGRNESRLGRLLDVRDYCKLHIVIHYIAKLLGAGASEPFCITPVAKVGADANGLRVVCEMAEAGIDTSYVRKVRDTPTLFSACFQYPDGSGGNITTSNSAAALLCEADIDESSRLLREGGSIALAVPEVPLPVRRYFLETATRCGAFRAASFAGAEVSVAREWGMFELLDLVALNEGEAEHLVGSAFSPESSEQFVKKCQELLRACYPKLKVVVSAGKLGAYGITAKEYGLCEAPEVKVASTAGAGDALLGGVIAATAAGIPFLPRGKYTAGHAGREIGSALQLGVLLGSYKCLSAHTIHPGASLDTLVEFAKARGFSFSTEIEKLFVVGSRAQAAVQARPESSSAM